MKNSQPTAENYTPERGDVFEWYGRCYICIDGGGSSGTVVQIGQNYHIKDFTWVIDDISPVFISKATEQEMEMYFGEQPETQAKKTNPTMQEFLTTPAANYMPEMGDLFEYDGRCYICMYGDAESRNVVAFSRGRHFAWRIGNATPVFIRKLSNTEIESLFGEKPSAGNILTSELTSDQQAEVLDKLFGAEYTEHLLVDYYGDNAFYADPDNLAFDFTTIGGIISYIRHTEYRKGYEACQGDMRKALGI